MGLQEWLIVAALFMLLFGAKKLPEMARSIGQSARVFKGEMKGMQADDEARARDAQQQPHALPAPGPGAAPGPTAPTVTNEGARTPDTPR